MSLKYEILKRLVKAANIKRRWTGMSTQALLENRRRANAKNRIPDLKDGDFDIRCIDMMGFPVLKLIHRQKADRANLFLIGGGMISAPLPDAVKKALRFAKETGLDVYVPYYPLCTDWPLTKAYEMIHETYRAMLREYPAGRISVLGTSSGGNLALGMVPYINDGHGDTPMPGYIMAISPGTCAATDIVGTVAVFLAMLVLMFVFDWRMGGACLLAAVVSVAAMFSMMGGKNAKLMQEYQAAQDVMSKAGTEYVRGIPVVKVFQQTVYSFRAFRAAIEDYSAKAERYTDGVCRFPQSVNLTFTEGAFIFLVPAALLLAPGALRSGNFAGFVTNFAFYAVFSAIISTALARIMFAASGMMLASTALGRIAFVMDAPTLPVTDAPQTPGDNSVEFRDVSFTYEGAEIPALDHVSFRVEPGQTVALVGPSGGGKTTAASLIPRFWDVTDGAVLVGGADVRQTDPHALMDHIAFVFQNTHLFKASILENVRAARPDATRGEAEAALMAAQCGDILEKLPDGMDTVIGTEGTYLSGGEQQRVALARAILKNAPIVVLDEATASLDVENETKVQGALSRLLAGKTVLVIAHRMRTVEAADRIVVLADGAVAEEGRPEELLARADSMFRRMTELQSASAQWSI